LRGRPRQICCRARGWPLNPWHRACHYANVATALDLRCRSNRLARLNKEVERPSDVVGIFPNEASIGRSIGAVMLWLNAK
jgi:transposase-like protein